MLEKWQLMHHLQEDKINNNLSTRSSVSSVHHPHHQHLDQKEEENHHHHYCYPYFNSKMVARFWATFPKVKPHPGSPLFVCPIFMPDTHTQ